MAVDLNAKPSNINFDSSTILADCTSISISMCLEFYRAREQEQKKTNNDDDGG
jgi:hypothetical protein